MGTTHAHTATSPPLPLRNTSCPRWKSSARECNKEEAPCYRC
jgi:hypothetical protein